VDAGKVTQIIQYEAQQNVPFPLAEVVWDYQILGASAGGELEVLLVAIKSEVVEGLFRMAAEAKLRLQLCDVSPAALCNAFRYNYGDLPDCTMLLDIGAKTSNLLFFENGKVFSRSISLGANSITQDFANEAKLKFEIAEQIKVAEGFVSLGGAYEEPENPNQAAISKIARQFMTKLHIQVNQTMQFYRGQQGGSAPQRLYLSGGASIMPYTAQFFAEKLNVPVEYFNPFRNVQIDAGVNLEELARVAHSLGEVVGLSLRNLANCPVEMNLMPASTLRWRTFNEKKPYFVATVFSLVAVAFAVGFLFQKLAESKETEIRGLEPQVAQKKARFDLFERNYRKTKATQKEVEQITTWMEQRYYWGDLLMELRRALIRAEDDIKKKLSAQRAGVEAGVWVEQLTFGAPPIPGTGPESPQPPPPPNPGEGDASSAAAAAASPAAATITLICRAVNLSNVDPSATTVIAYTVESELKASPFFDPRKTALLGNIVTDEATGTFTFGIIVGLTNSPNLNM
jgi:type IV pilus assembly protein PilM